MVGKVSWLYTAWNFNGFDKINLLQQPFLVKQLLTSLLRKQCVHVHERPFDVYLRLLYSADIYERVFAEAVESIFV